MEMCISMIETYTYVSIKCNIKNLLYVFLTYNILMIDLQLFQTYRIQRTLISNASRNSTIENAYLKLLQ